MDEGMINMDELKNTVATQLKEILDKSNLTQSEFAEKCSLTKDTVSKIINGKMALSVTSAIKIANALGVSLDYLFGLSEFPNDAYCVYYYIEHQLRYAPWQLAENTPKFSALLANAVFIKYWNAMYQAKTLDLPANIKEGWIAQSEQELIADLQDGKTTDSEAYILVPAKNINNENLEHLKSLFE